MVNIDNYLDMLKAAAQAIEAAPQKGFVNLDAVKDSILKTCEVLREISPKLRFAERLLEDEHREILAKLKVMRKAGAAALIDQAQKTLDSGSLDYEQYRSLRDEINGEFDKIFGGKFWSPAPTARVRAAAVRKPEDFN